jgi:hypothetical protein
MTTSGAPGGLCTPGEHRETVRAGEAHVRQDEVVGLAVEVGKGRLGVGHRVDLVRLLRRRKELDEERPKRRLVFDDEHARHGVQSCVDAPMGSRSSK